MTTVRNIALVERPKPPPPKVSKADLCAAVDAFKWCLGGMPRVVKMDPSKLEQETVNCLRDVVVIASRLGIDLPLMRH